MNIFTITQQHGITMNTTDFQANFYLISSTETEIFKTLEEKFKGLILKKQWQQIDDQFYIKKLQFLINDRDTIQKINECFKFIKSIIENQQYERISINVQLDTLKQRMLFKNTLEEYFKETNASIIFFNLNTVELKTENDKMEIMKIYHISAIGGHVGAEKMYNTIKQFFTWRNMIQDIRKFVKACPICEKTKITVNTHTPMQITSNGNCLFDHAFIDFVGPVPETEDGYKYIFTATCDLTKMVVAVPTKDCTAITTAETLLEHVLLRYNFPSNLISDNALNFKVSKVLKEINKLLAIKKIFSTPYRAQSNKIERQHRTINAYFRAYAEQNASNWNKLIKYATFVCNNTVQSTTGYSPHELCHGFKIIIPNSITKSQGPYNYDNLADEIRSKIKESLEIAKEKLMKQKLTNKRNYDRNVNEIDVAVGDLVLVKNFNKLHKFDNVYEGPFRVIDAQSHYVTIMKRGKPFKIHKDYLKPTTTDHKKVPTEVFPTHTQK